MILCHDSEWRDLHDGAECTPPAVPRFVKAAVLDQDTQFSPKRGAKAGSSFATVLHTGGIEKVRARGASPKALHTH